MSISSSFMRNRKKLVILRQSWEFGRWREEEGRGASSYERDFPGLLGLFLHKCTL